MGARKQTYHCSSVVPLDVELVSLVEGLPRDRDGHLAVLGLVRRSRLADEGRDRVEGEVSRGTLALADPNSHGGLSVGSDRPSAGATLGELRRMRQEETPDLAVVLQTSSRARSERRREDENVVTSRLEAVSLVRRDHGSPKRQLDSCN